MVTIEELKLGNRTLEALKFLLEQTTELETAISQINISEIKDANTLTKEQIATLQDVKNAVETINSDLSLKKSDFDEKKQNFDNNMSAFRDDKADFDEKKADFDSKNNTALNNFAFIANNVKKINSVSALLAEAKNVLETIKPIEQRTQAALNTIANSQAKFDELEALKATLLGLKRSLENINTTGLINDNTISETTTYSSKKVETLLNEKANADDLLDIFNDGKIKAEILPGIDATTLNGKKADVFELKRDSQIKFDTLNQNVERVKGSLNQGLNSLSNSLGTKISSNLKGVANGVATLNNLGKIPIEQLPKIDTYTKEQSDEKFALKDDLPELATEKKEGIAKLKNSITAKEEDAAVTEKALVEFVQSHTPPALGVEQTWQDVTSKRDTNITYTNTTEKPIMVMISGEPRIEGDLFIFVNGAKIFTQELDATSVTSLSFIVPPKATYRAEAYYGNGSSTRRSFSDIFNPNYKLWAELK